MAKSEFKHPIGPGSKSKSNADDGSSDIAQKLQGMQASIAKSLALQEKSISNINSFLEDQLKLIGKISDDRKDQKKFQDDADKARKIVLTDQEKLLNSYDDVVDVSKSYLDILKRGGLINTDMGKNMLAHVGQQQKQANVAAAYLNTLTQEANVNAIISENMVDIVAYGERYKSAVIGSRDAMVAMQDQSNKVIKGSYELVDLETLIGTKKLMQVDLAELLAKKSKLNVDTDGEQIAQLDTITIKMGEQLGILDSQLEGLDAMNMSMKNAASKFGEMKDITKSVTGVVDKLGSSITAAASKIPGGEMFAKAFDVDGISKNIQSKLGGVLDGALGKIGPGGMTHAMKIFGGMAGGFALGALTFIMHTLSEVDAEISQIGKDFGVSRDVATEMHHSAIDLSEELEVVGVHAKEITKGMMETSKIMGGLNVGQLSHGNEALKQMIGDVTVLTEKFGATSEEVSNIQSLATISGKSMGEMVKSSDSLGKGLLSSTESMKALASIPKGVAVAFKGGTTELIKAAQKAKLLGMELGKVQSIGDGMLDIEDSLGKEMEARVLTGKNLNLDLARQYALQGDIGGLQDEILTQAGSLAEFSDMNRIQQKSFADAMGMTVDEMTTMLTNAEKLRDVGLSQEKVDQLHKMNAKDLAKEMANATSDKQKAYIAEIAKQKESASIQEGFSNTMAKLQEKLQKLLTPLLEMVHHLLDSKEMGETLDDVMSTVGVVIANIVPIVKAVFTVLSSMLSPILGITKMMGGVDDKTKAVHSSFGGVLSVLGLIGGFFFGKALLVKGMGLLKDGAVSVGKSIMSNIMGSLGKVGGKLGGMAGKLGKLMPGKSKAVSLPGADKAADKGGGMLDTVMKSVEKMDPKKILAGSVAILIISAALWVAAKAMQQFSTGVSWDGVLMGIVTLGALVLAVVALGMLMTSGVGAVAIIAGAAALLILSGALLVMGVAMQQFAKAAVIAIPVFESFFNGVGSILTTVGGIMVNVINAIGDNLTKLIGSFVELGNLNAANLIGVAAGIYAIGMALVAFGAGGAVGSVLDGVGSAINSLFGGNGSPMEQIMTISEKLKPDALSKTAVAIRDLADAFRYFAEETAKLKDFDVDKLDVMIQKISEARDAQSGGIGGAIVSGANAITGMIGNLFSSPEEQKSQSISGPSGDSSPKGDKLDQVISLLTQIVGSANQPTVIKFGEKTVEEIKGQLNLKKAYNIKVDNTYGRSI